ncbi:MAG: NADH-quinone oxidoreductase subunit C [Deltaproteobacteria bacterium]|nr:NADH-quinone oxidoreductase subunit C [Deltaproteobacteria bacterium]
MLLDDVAAALEELGPDKVLRPDYKTRGAHLDVTVAADKVVSLARALREKGFLLRDLAGVDGTPEMMVVYHFCHPRENCAVQGRALIPREKPELPTIHEVYPGANWHEREAHDFHGIVFRGHPDLSPLILPEDAGDLRPLLKSEANVRAIGSLIPEFAPPTPEGAEAEAGAKPRPKKERPPKDEGEA